MKISNDKVVSLSYQLMVDGEVVDRANADNPLQFVYGKGMLLPLFESNLLDKVAGDKFGFVLAAADGYGVQNPEAIVEIPLDVFMIDGELEEDLLVVGNVIPMQNQQGQRMDGKVCELKAEAVVLDFNHPLAGKDLHFTGEVIEVRDANDEELQQGLGGGGCCGGDCGCGSGEGSCGDGEGCDSEEGCGCGSGGCGSH